MALHRHRSGVAAGTDLPQPQRGVSALFAEIPVGGIWGGEALPCAGGAGGSPPLRLTVAGVAVAALVLAAGAAGAQVVTAHVGEGVVGGHAVHLDAAALGRRRVLEVARAARLEAGRKHGLRAGAVRDRVCHLRVGLGGLGPVGAAARRRLTAARRRGVAPPVGRVPATGLPGLLPAGPLTAGLLPAAWPLAEGSGR